MAKHQELSKEAQDRVDEASAALERLGMPRKNRGAAPSLTLLAMLNLTPETPWAEAQNPSKGITPMMDYFSAHYGKSYKPNSREMVRKNGAKAFVFAGLAVDNPDQPLAKNSQDYAYQIVPEALQLFRTWDSDQWESALTTYMTRRGLIIENYLAVQADRDVQVELPGGKPITLSPGGQNVLIKNVIEQFCPTFVPNAEILYVGDAGERKVVNEPRLRGLGVTLDMHGALPDVVAYYPAKKWLILIEAVATVGAIDRERHAELTRVFEAFNGEGLVFVTSFLERDTMRRHLPSISWHTEAWIAQEPTHLIHFNGERFLGPYKSES